MAANKGNEELKQFIDSYTMEGKKLEELLIDITLYSEGAILLADLYNMPLKMINSVQSRIQIKIDKSRPKNNKMSQKMVPGEVSKESATPQPKVENR